MDSVTLLGLVGIGGTLLGTVVGALGTRSAASVTIRGQTSVEEQKARRQAYSACSTALMARRDDTIALLQTFLDDDFNQVDAQVRLQSLDEQRGSVARSVGAVVVEGPDAVAVHAESAAESIEALASRLRDWVASVSGGLHHADLVESEMRFARQGQTDALDRVGMFSEACRDVLHPEEKAERMARRRQLRRRRERRDHPIE